MGSDAQTPSQQQPAHLAVYDFDGTCITGNSPAMLVPYLLAHRMLPFHRAIEIGFWALAYKLRLPQNESWVRSKVFSAFEGKPKADVDAFLAAFYDEKIAPRVRPAALASMRRDKEAGRLVVIVSASWSGIVARAARDLPFDHALTTRMVVDDEGRYTTQVDGVPVEGEEKVRALTRFANAAFGPGAWCVDAAYGDHHFRRPPAQDRRPPLRRLPRQSARARGQAPRLADRGLVPRRLSAPLRYRYDFMALPVCRPHARGDARTMEQTALLNYQ